MSEYIAIFNILGYISTCIVVISVVTGLVLWSRGILRILYRLGNGLVKRKISIFASIENVGSLKALLLDSELFSKDNIIEITSRDNFGKSEKSTVFLVFWKDWKNEEDRKEILKKKTDKIALVIYAPQKKGPISKDDFKKINLERNVTVANLRGRLLNDIVSFMITTSYEKK